MCVCDFFLQETTKIAIKFTSLVCSGPYSIIWIIVCYGCVVITQVVGVVLAFRTRNVTIKALNDSKYLTIIIYISSVIIVAMVASAVLIEDRINADAAVFGGLFIIFSTVVLGLTFIPKVNSKKLLSQDYCNLFSFSDGNFI